VRRDVNNKVVHVGASNLIWLLENNTNVSNRLKTGADEHTNDNNELDAEF